MKKQIIAFDIGDKRIGVALSDPFGEYAVPSDTYFRTGVFETDVNAIAELAKKWGAEVIVCGLPVNKDGTKSVQSEKTEKFVSALEAKAGVPVCLEDERFTTRAARDDLVAMGVSAKKDKKKKHVDSLAAAYILESYLERTKKGERIMKEEKNDYEDEENIVELIDEEGNKLAFEHLMTFEYKKEWFVALVPVEGNLTEGADDDEGEEVAIFRLVGGEDDESLEIIEDEQLLDEVFDEFDRLYNEDDEDGAEED